MKREIINEALHRKVIIGELVRINITDIQLFSLWGIKIITFQIAHIRYSPK